MSRALVLGLIIACKGNDHTPAPGSAVPAAAAPPPTLKLVGCAPAQLPPRPSGAAGAGEHVADTREWTPYAASEALAPNDIATVAATELEAAIRTRLPKLEACFGGRTASLRAVLRVAFDGGVIGARAGGVGDHQVEACVAGALIGIKVSAPPIIAEVACDLQRGDPQPWRITVDAGYRVLEAANPAPAPPEGTFVLLAETSDGAKVLDRTMTSAVEGSATIVAVRVDHGAPVFAGMGIDGRSAQRSSDPAGAKPVVIDPSAEPIVACVGRTAIAEAPRASLDTLFATIKKACASITCASSIDVALAGTATAKDFADLAAAARRAGYDRLVLGGDARCTR